MKEKPDFLKSAAVIGIELLKLAFSTAYILFVEKKPFSSIITFMREDYKNSILLAFPAAAYSLQMTLEFVALSNIDAAVFSVVVQSKLLATASFAVLILGKKIRQVQLVSLVLLTCGVMLCNMKVCHFLSYRVVSCPCRIMSPVPSASACWLRHLTAPLPPCSPLPPPNSNPKSPWGKSHMAQLKNNPNPSPLEQPHRTMVRAPVIPTSMRHCLL